jgi:hypothetical protein
LGLLTTGATSPGCHSGVPLVPLVFRASLMERCATVCALVGAISSLDLLSSNRLWAHHASEVPSFDCFEVAEWILRSWRFGAWSVGGVHGRKCFFVFCFYTFALK